MASMVSMWTRRVFIWLLISITLLMLMAGNVINMSFDLVDSQVYHFRYTSVKGFFFQDEMDTDESTFDPLTMNFGLIEQEYDTDSDLPNSGKSLTQWQRFAHKLKVMNDEAAEGETFRLLYLGRHGQGYHNAASTYYGFDAWRCYYAPLEGDPLDSGIVWADANLTRIGIHQARELNRFWAGLIEQKCPTPEEFYVSPLTRACQTAELTFRFLELPPGAAPFIPTVTEFIRERTGIHTCDRRGSRHELKRSFPYYEFESSFKETDELWDPIYREPLASIDHRAQLFFDEIFALSKPSKYISLTSHGGLISSILRLSGHRSFYLGAGAVIPVLLKTDKIEGKRPKGPSETGDQKPECTGDPLRAGLDGYDSLGDYVRHIEKGYPAVE